MVTFIKQMISQSLRYSTSFFLLLSMFDFKWFLCSLRIRWITHFIFIQLFSVNCGRSFISQLMMMMIGAMNWAFSRRHCLAIDLYYMPVFYGFFFEFLWIWWWGSLYNIKDLYLRSGYGIWFTWFMIEENMGILWSTRYFSIPAREAYHQIG